MPMRPDYTLAIWPGDIDKEIAIREDLITYIHFDAKYRLNKIVLEDNQSEENVEKELTEEKKDFLKQIFIIIYNSMIELVNGDLPQVRLHRAFAVRRILLRREVDLILRDLHQIFLTRLHSSRHSDKACASIQLIRRNGRRTLVRSYHVETGTYRVFGGCHTVGCQ